MTPPRSSSPVATAQSRNHRISQLPFRGAGFTLIEMLVVIAIIAILAGIIFPVFASVRENARRSACISNLREIFQHVKSYELDNGEYPKYLFTPAIKADGTLATAPAEAISMEEARNISTVRNQTIFPEYARSLDIFHCPNNITSGGESPKVPGVGGVVSVQRREPDRASATVSSAPPLQTRLFYKYDSYSANLRVDTATRRRVDPASANAYVARYRTFWADQFYDPASVPPAVGADNYGNQLLWDKPSDETLITACSYHVDRGGTMILLWLNGTAKTVPIDKVGTLQDKSGGPTSDTSTDYDLFKIGPTD